MSNPSKVELGVLSALSSLAGAVVLAIFFAVLVLASGQTLGVAVLSFFFFGAITVIVIFPVWLFVFLPLALFVPSQSILWKPYVMPFCGLVAAPFCLLVLGTALPLVGVDPAGRFGTLTLLPAIVGVVTCLIASLLHQHFVKLALKRPPVVLVLPPIPDGEIAPRELVFLSLRAAFAGFIASVLLAGILFEAVRSKGGVVLSALPTALMIIAFVVEFLFVWLLILLPLALYVPSRSALWNPSTLTLCGVVAGPTLPLVSVMAHPSDVSLVNLIALIMFAAIIGGLTCLTGALLHEKLLKEKMISP